MIGEHRDADERAGYRDELVTTDRSSTGLIARRAAAEPAEAHVLPASHPQGGAGFTADGMEH
jgi:hypothetical protein